MSFSCYNNSFTVSPFNPVTESCYWRLAKDEDVALQWAKLKVNAGQQMVEGAVGVTVIHQWRWDSASLW